MSDPNRYEIMTMVSNPDNYLSWPAADKVNFLNRVVRWHDYVDRLKQDGHVSDAWGSQTLQGMRYNVATKFLLIALYNVTLDQYSELISQDPLWHYGVYNAPILKSIEGDYEDDFARYSRIR